MTEYNSFSVSNMKEICRACLRSSERVFPMALAEINLYQRFIEEIKMDWDMYICIQCRWLMNKCVKFSIQCQKANNMLYQNIKCEEIPLIMDLRIFRSEINYPDAEDQEFNEPQDYGDDHSNDDDEMPLVMFQELKRRNEDKLEPEIKEEIEIKLEFPQECGKRKKKKEIREGFSSRMVQETEEYLVIKLTKEQVLSEMADKALTESYIRSPYKCEKCVKGFNFEQVLLSHMEKHRVENGTYQCDICTQYCKSPVSLRGHIKSHTTRYQCKLCGQVRLSRQHLLEHHAITHTSAPTTYSCDKCQFTTNKRTVIQRHVKITHSGERHECEHCGKVFGSLVSLRVHNMRHDKSKRLECDQCEKKFIYPSLLKKHVQAVHERKDYYCVECDVRFKSPDTLRIHFKKAKRHRDASSYNHACPLCPLRLPSSSSLSGHLSSAHAQPRPFPCARCRRRYSSRDALRSHTWRHHQRGGCQDENKARKSVLKVHVRSQSGPRPHACDCGATFTQLSSLRTHQITKHSKQEELIQNGTEQTPNLPQEG
ncbi:zinc finger protein 43-like isoform X2 [Trichoplusia ni]|uniref:Zinc finger protein 43-like isoform X2 n=1 Tax=Trichoplusia ni TaxID=7111 RepID=A0A7E5X5U9_TRINI|nr:zinc finger protein 43-like isoform X2 [Trichoplusia ni]